MKKRCNKSANEKDQDCYHDQQPEKSIRYDRKQIRIVNQRK